MAELAVKAVRTLHGDLPVTEGLVWKDFRLGSFFESKEHLADAPDVFIPEFAVLLSEVLSERLSKWTVKNEREEEMKPVFEELESERRKRIDTFMSSAPRVREFWK